MRYFFVLLGLCLLQGLALGQPMRRQAKGMELSKRPFFYYQFAGERGDSVAARAAGDQLRIQYTLHTADKKGQPKQILLSSYDQTTPVLVQLPAPEQDIFFTAALRKMQVGDSLHVLVPADSIRDYLGEVDKFFKKKSAVFFTYKLLEVKDLTEFREAAKVEKERADSIRNLMRVTILDLEKKQPSDLGFSASASGLQYKILQKGDPAKPANAAQLAQVHYLCYLPTGALLDDSYQSAQPISIAPAQRANYIKGWIEGIDLLGEGGQAMLVIPSDLAYGEKGAGAMIPPNSTIIFWIEVIHVAHK